METKEGPERNCGGNFLSPRIINYNRKLVIKILAGEATIANARQVFKVFIDDDFNKWGLNKPGIATKEICVDVYENVSDGNFWEIFQALPGTWDQKWLSQNQIIDFCEMLSFCLRREEHSTMFLIKGDEKLPINKDIPQENLFVVQVRVRPGGLHVRLSQLTNRALWHGTSAHRIVVPQINRF